MTSHSSKRHPLTLRSAILCFLTILAFSSFFSAAAQTQPVVPFYRYVRIGPPRISTDYYFYTTEPTEAASRGFSFHKLAGYIYTMQVAGTVPLYRMYVTTPYYSGAPNRYLYATDTNPVSAYGYTYDGIAGYVYPGDANQFPSGGPFSYVSIVKIWGSSLTAHSGISLQRAAQNLCVFEPPILTMATVQTGYLTR